MADRQIIEWDKDDIDILKFMERDVLAIGRLSCMKHGFDLLEEHKGKKMELVDVSAEASYIDQIKVKTRDFR